MQRPALRENRVSVLTLPFVVVSWKAYIGNIGLAPWLKHIHCGSLNTHLLNSDTFLQEERSSKICFRPCVALAVLL